VVLLCPIAHPAWILRGMYKHEPAQATYLRRAKALADGTATPPPDPTTPPTNAIFTPGLHDLQLFREGLDRCTDKTLATDIECAGKHLVGIGFCRHEDLHCLYVPIRRRAALPYWTDPADLMEVVVWLDEILGNPDIPLVFHNGNTFDEPFLRRVGFEVRGFVDDTMVMVHTAYPELPKALEFNAVLYCGFNPWKHLSSVEEVGEGK